MKMQILFLLVGGWWVNFLIIFATPRPGLGNQVAPQLTQQWGGLVDYGISSCPLFDKSQVLDTQLCKAKARVNRAKELDNIFDIHPNQMLTARKGTGYGCGW